MPIKSFMSKNTEIFLLNNDSSEKIEAFKLIKIRIT